MRPWWASGLSLLLRAHEKGARRRAPPTFSHSGIYFSSHPPLFLSLDAASYFMMAYECDWLWALGLENETTPMPLGSFLDSLAFGGYNQVLLNFYANYSRCAGRALVAAICQIRGPADRCSRPRVHATPSVAGIIISRDRFLWAKRETHLGRRRTSCS